MRRLAGNLVLLFLTIALLGIGGEVLLRTLEGETDDTPLRTATTDPFVPRLIPGTHAVRSGADIRINDIGLRNDPVAVPKPAGRYRILCVGDSYTFGTGVDQDETIPAALEDALRSHPGGDSVESINLGIDGANTYDCVARLEHIGFALEPDLVVLFFLFNDVFRMERGREWLAGRTYDADAARVAHVQAKRESYVVKYLAPRVAGIVRGVLGQKTGKLANWDDQFREDVPAWRVTRDVLLEARSKCAARGIRLIIALLPAFATFTEDAYPLPRYRSAVQAFGEEADIPVVDLHEPFWGESGRRYWINPLDPHPDEAACDIMATYLADRLVALGVGPSPRPVTHEE